MNTTLPFSHQLVWAVVLYCGTTGPVTSAELKDYFKNADQRAAELLEQGDATAAGELFSNPQWQGVSQYRAGNYQDAMQNFSQAEDASSLYNHGTAAARAGDYNQAVTSLQAALDLDPQNNRIEQNLEIARKLQELSDENNQQENEGEQQPEDQQSEGEPQDDENSEQQDESEQGEQSSDQQQGESKSDSGELNEEDAQQQNEQLSDAELEELREQMQQQAGEESESPPEGEPQAEVPVDSSVSEDDQATQQWLRRIPDDASQLLRNKIRLNHILEHPDVQDMQEAW